MNVFKSVEGIFDIGGDIFMLQSIFGLYSNIYLLTATAADTGVSILRERKTETISNYRPCQILKSPACLGLKSSILYVPAQDCTFINMYAATCNESFFLSVMTTDADNDQLNFESL